MRVLAGKAAERAVSEAGRPGIAVGRGRTRGATDHSRACARAAIRRWYAMPHCGTAFRRVKPLRVPQQEIEEAWKATPLRTREALKRAAANIPTICQLADTASWQQENQRWRIGAGRSSAAFRGMLCAGRTLSAAVDAADDGDSGAGRRRGANRRGHAESAAGDAGGRASAGDQRGLPLRRSAGDRGAGVSAPRASRAWTRLSGRAMRTSPRRRNW